MKLRYRKLSKKEIQIFRLMVVEKIKVGEHIWRPMRRLTLKSIIEGYSNQDFKNKIEIFLLSSGALQLKSKSLSEEAARRILREFFAKFREQARKTVLFKFPAEVTQKLLQILKEKSQVKFKGWIYARNGMGEPMLKLESAEDRWFRLYINEEGDVAIGPDERVTPSLAQKIKKILIDLSEVDTDTEEKQGGSHEQIHLKSPSEGKRGEKKKDLQDGGRELGKTSTSEEEPSSSGAVKAGASEGQDAASGSGGSPKIGAETLGPTIQGEPGEVDTSSPSLGWEEDEKRDGSAASSSQEPGEKASTGAQDSVEEGSGGLLRGDEGEAEPPSTAESAAYTPKGQENPKGEEAGVVPRENPGDEGEGEPLSAADKEGATSSSEEGEVEVVPTGAREQSTVPSSTAAYEEREETEEAAELRELRRNILRRFKKENHGSQVSTQERMSYGGVFADLSAIKASKKLIELARDAYLQMLSRGGEGEEGPRWNYRKISQRVAGYLQNWRVEDRKKEDGRPAVLVLPDVSGSMSTYAEDVVAASVALQKTGIPGGEIVVVAQSNGFPVALYEKGKLSEEIDYNPEEKEAFKFYQQLKARYDIKAVFILADWDGAWLYRWIAQNWKDVTIYWMDVWSSSVLTPRIVPFPPKWLCKTIREKEQFIREWGNRAIRRIVYAFGCGSAEETLKTLRKAVKRFSQVGTTP